mmetsp:Transcript_17234/g.51586  ORF Transcript_17234/g.51586 Transcript_17234/m.51586 type:complete len:269 (+) Transcript_17234:936-1742(+)
MGTSRFQHRCCWCRCRHHARLCCDDGWIRRYARRWWGTARGSGRREPVHDATASDDDEHDGEPWRAAGNAADAFEPGHAAADAKCQPADASGVGCQSGDAEHAVGPGDAPADVEPCQLARVDADAAGYGISWRRHIRCAGGRRRTCAVQCGGHAGCAGQHGSGGRRGRRRVRDAGGAVPRGRPRDHLCRPDRTAGGHGVLGPASQRAGSASNRGQRQRRSGPSAGVLMAGCVSEGLPSCTSEGTALCSGKLLGVCMFEGAQGRGLISC